MAKILKSIALWIGFFFLFFIVAAIVVPKNDALIGVIIAFPIISSTIIVSKISPLYGLYGKAWDVFLTIFRYVLDAIIFLLAFMSFCGENPILLLLLGIICPYIVNFKNINTTFEHLKAISPKIETRSTAQSPDTKREYPIQSHSSSTKSIQRPTTMARIDRMEGHDFERFTAALLRELGYERVKVTPSSGDQGVDVIAYKDGKKYAIQCKRYSQKLGNTPIQEVHAGKTIYGCNVAVVLTNNYFTEGGKEAAKALGVELWDRDMLQRMIAYAGLKARK